MTAPRIASVRILTSPLSRVLRATALVATLLASSALVGCDGGLDISNEDLPSPAISQGEAVLVCGSAAGSATLTLSDLGTTIVTGAPGQLQGDRILLTGSSTGLDPAMHAVVIFLLPLGTDCPAYEQGPATLAANGSFSGDLEFSDDVFTYRALAVAVPTGTAISCASTDACVDAPGYLAQSNALEITP